MSDAVCVRGREVHTRRGGAARHVGACAGRVPHLVARVDSNGGLDRGEDVQDEGRVGVGRELATAVRGVLGVVRVQPVLDVGDRVLCVQALRARMSPGRRRLLQGDHVLVRHGAELAVIDGEPRSSANACDQE